MSGFLRRAGRTATEDGRTVTWTVADGTRGRRWRATVAGAPQPFALDASLLLEVSPDGRPVRLELSTPAGMLTLHPEADGALHGNAVTAGGVAHLVFPWDQDAGLDVHGLVIPAAVTAARLSRDQSVGEGRRVRVVVVTSELAVRAEEHRYARLDAGNWAIERPTGELRLSLDTRGVPVWPAAAEEWPLELEPEG
jgi:hypothetical protein